MDRITLNKRLSDFDKNNQIEIKNKQKSLLD